MRQAVGPLSHLMSDRSSPVSHLYLRCSLCESISNDANLARKALLEHGEALQAAKETQSSEHGDHQLTALQGTVEALSSAVGRLDWQKMNHMKTDHPYQPFPLAALERAVAGVPLSRYSIEDLPLLSFGPSYRFRAGVKKQLRQLPRPPVAALHPLVDGMPIQLDIWSPGKTAQLAEYHEGNALSPQDADSASRQQQQQQQKPKRALRTKHRASRKQQQVDAGGAAQKQQQPRQQQQHPQRRDILSPPVAACGFSLSAGGVGQQGFTCRGSLNGCNSRAAVGSMRLASAAAAFLGRERHLVSTHGHSPLTARLRPWLMRWHSTSATTVSAQLLRHRAYSVPMRRPAALRTRLPFACVAVARCALPVF